MAPAKIEDQSGDGIRHLIARGTGLLAVAAAAAMSLSAVVYAETIEDALDNGDDSCEHDGVSYSWWTETA